MAGRLKSKRVLILGAETEIGRAVAIAVAQAGASVAAVAATGEAEAAFAVQRLARRLSAERKVIAQAIDATNEAAVRVMVRQVSKELGGLDAAIFCADVNGPMFDAMRLFTTAANRELIRAGGGCVVLAPLGFRGGHFELVSGAVTGSGEVTEAVPIPRLVNVNVLGRPPDDVIAEVLSAIAGEADSG